MSTMRPSQIAALEQTIIEASPLGLVHVPDQETEAYDATLLNADNPVPVEIKTCRDWLRVSGSNGDRRRGRFLIRRQAHERLLELGELYLLGLLDADERLLWEDVFEAATLDPILDGHWTNGGRYGETCQLNWSVIFDTEVDP